MSFLSTAILALAWVQDASDDFEGSAGAWDRVRSENHPAYNRIGVEQDPSQAPSGTRYLRMVSQGGNTAVELNPGAGWTVEPDRAYRLSAFARLVGTRRNTASISLVWRDAEFRPVGTPLRSSPFPSPGSWRELTLEAPRVPAGAVVATVRLDFEGPDVRGEAGFDRVVLEPCVLLDVRPVGRALPVFHPDERVSFEVTAYGTRGEATLEVVTRSWDGREAARTEWPVAPGTPARVELAPVRGGSFRVEAILSRGKENLAARDLPLLIPNPPWLGAEAPWLGVYFHPMSEPFLGAGELARLAGARRAVVPIDGPASLDVVRSLAAQSVRVVGVGRRRPPGSAEFVDDWESPRPTVPGVGYRGEFLRRLVRLAASETRPERVDVTLDPTMFEIPGYPRDSFLDVRAANDILSGASVRHGLQGSPIQAAFEKGGETVLVLWSTGAATTCAMPWGDRAELYDPRAATRPLGPDEPLTVTDYPVFVGRVDAESIAAWQAMRFEADSLPLRRGPSAGTLRFRPAAARAVVRDLRVSILPPAGWTVRAPESALSWPQGQDASQELTFLLPPDEQLGVREIGVEVTFLEGNRRRTVRKTIPVRVTSPIDIKADVAHAPVGKKVSVRIANGSSRKLTLVATVRLPGLPDQLEFLGTLSPGESARPLEYLVKDPAAAGRVEVRVEERTGERLFARRVVPLR